MSLCFDGGTGAYEDKLMNKHHVGPFDLMFNIQFAKMLLAGLGLVVTGQITGFFNVSGVILVWCGGSWHTKRFTSADPSVFFFLLHLVSPPVFFA